jgi:hypothetical protein
VRCFNVALSSASGSGKMTADAGSDRRRLLASGMGPDQAVDVALETLDGFASRHGVEHIDLLKIDTEGHDLEVLKGAAGMLDRNAISIIQVEAGMNSRNTLHVPLEEFRSYLEPRGFFLFRIYDQVAEWPTREPNLRRTNPVFISSEVIERNRREPR